MRHPHILRRNAGTEQPSQVIFVDVETHDKRLSFDSVQAVLTFGWAAFTQRTPRNQWTDAEWFRFDSAFAFWNWALSKTRAKTKLYMVCHNASFDFPVLEAFNVLQIAGYKLHKAIIEDPPTAFVFRSGDRSICLFDNLNLFRMPLSQIGASFGLSKLKMPGKKASLEAWDTYCRRDVEVLMKGFVDYLAFLEIHDLGNFALTLPSQALTSFRHRFMKHEILIDNNERALELARSSYLGGRCEAFRIGKVAESLHMVDINSMYPFVMFMSPVPYRLDGTSSHVSLDDLGRMLVNRACFADVDIETRVPAFPLKHKGRMIFPVGRFRIPLADPELRLAFNMDAIRNIHSVARYYADVLFDDYVQFFYQRRQLAKAHGDKKTDLMCKLFMNSLYGKFGQNGRKWEKVCDTSEDGIFLWHEIDADTRQVRQFRRFLGVVEELKNESEARDSHPAIASMITSAARLYLWQLIQQAGLEHVIYVDTDSLIVDDVGFHALADKLDSSTLGKLKLEESAPFADIRGLKDYTFGTKNRIKGVRKSAKKIDNTTYTQDSFRGYAGMMQASDLNKVVIRKVTKHLTRKYQKGAVSASGLVLPYLADGVVLVPHLCSKCNQYSPFCDQESIVTGRETTHTGYAFGDWKEPARSLRVTKHDVVMTCLPCLGREIPPELLALQEWISSSSQPDS